VIRQPVSWGVKIDWQLMPKPDQSSLGFNHTAKRSSANRLNWQSSRHLQSQQRRVLLAAVNIAVVLGARALRTGKAHFDRQRGVVVDDDDFGRVAVIEAMAARLTISASRARR
jgi:hypothetical protein